MHQHITKEDLEVFKLELLSEIKRLINDENLALKPTDPGWLRSKAVRSLLNISPATLQNLRVTGRIRYRKVLGSYYYSKEDITLLFKDDD
ncbi:helix-turn-helix domain-containing protein [Sphingobacterium bambusae]|uniref:Helix-turn-helix domain-containing protein n=1 Tax=Sphingobacterium bambusae TaxID=662858 RepID=A0ABW6BJW8_9SPHI|nr:helix-turn-helix domain-containing protein [Sphingobacterium bambusae]WPL49369.1 helix-turn-helix domain-containing protein [Sphingobacterium bambusae]